MTKSIPLFLLVALALLSTGAAAQTYSLEECIALALKNNQQLKNSQLDVATANYRIKEAKSALLPTVDITGQSLYYKDLPAQYAPASAFGGPDGEYTRLSLNMAQTTTANIQLTQSLFNQAVITGVKAARVTQEAVALQDDVVRENVVYSVMATYYTIQVLTDNLQRLQENIANLEKTTAINGVLKSNELVSDNVHNRMLINVENLRNQYENQKLTLDQNVTTLKYLLDLDMHGALHVAAFDYTETLASADAATIAQRADIKLQQAQIRLSHLDKKSVIAGYYPVLTNTFSFGYTGYNDTFGPFEPIHNDWVRSSYFAFTLKIPVFDGFRKQNQVRQKEAAIRQNMNTLAMMEANASKEVEDAIHNFDANKTLLVSNKKSLDLAQQLFDSAQGEYESGITSVTELLNAQNDLTDARTNYSAALLNLKLAELELKKASGTLVEKQ